MRIQHNIMAMSAYRNYTNNVSAMKKNLEKLSSGYKINRAGDDAAGLAISEKMRAQITGLETAQKNAKDGISLVQTAEGALTEVHDMLNRMVELATQSANGTYDNETDRYQLQKEVDQLRAEIDRIADSANFNGIKLLNGDLTRVKGEDSYVETVQRNGDFSGMDRIITSTLANGEAYPVAGKQTILDGDSASATRAQFQIDLSTMEFGANKTFKVNTGSTTTFTISIATAGGGTSAGSITIKLGSLAANKMIEAGETFTVASASVSGTTTKVKVQITVGANGSMYAKLLTNKNAAGSKTYSLKTPVSTTALAQATNVKVNDTVSIKIGDKTLTTGTKGFRVTGSLSDTNIANAVAKAIVAENSVIDLNGVKWAVSTLGNGKLKFEQIAKPETRDQARANFDVKIDIAAGSKSVSANGTGIGAFGTAGSIKMSASIKPGTYVYKNGVAAEDANKANTIFRMEEDDIVDGAVITIGTRTLTLAVGDDSEVLKGSLSKATGAGKTSGYVKVNVNDDLNTVLNKISYALGSTVNFKITAANGSEKEVSFQIGVSDSTQGFPSGLAVQRVNAAATDTNAMVTIGGSQVGVKFDTLEKLANNFSLKYNGTKKIVHEAVEAKNGLTLQIGDTADDFNQLRVSIEDMHTSSMGIKDGKSIADISIADQESAAEAVDVIKAAINYVSDVRGTLGATQNRLDHTINNLSVMTENIQDAESTIRDVDVAEEMMAYTKNNILIQSAQAMLAQANQVPQGVLQLLQ